VTVVPHGVSRLGAEPARRRAGLDVPAPFVLTVGLEPRKNVERLVRAFGALDRDFPQHSLVAVGIDGPRARRAIAAVRALGTRGRVLLDVPDAQLAELYRRCDLFCFPSLGEGFGLPVLEAMHAGAAVVASTRASLPEVGGGAVEYVDALDERALTAIIRRLLVSPERRAELGRAARDRAGTFSWDRSAAAIAGELAAAAP
jgi:glycosyltransferase involved in cell wall biosynthesis